MAKASTKPNDDKDDEKEAKKAEKAAEKEAKKAEKEAKVESIVNLSEDVESAQKPYPHGSPPDPEAEYEKLFGKKRGE